MALRSIYRKNPERPTEGNTLPKYMLALGIGSAILLAVALVVLGARTFAGVAHHADMNASATEAIDRMTSDIRASARLLSFDPKRIVLDLGANRPSVTYSYSIADKALTRQEGENPEMVLLTGCASLDFVMYEPLVASSNLTMPVTSNPTNAKAVGVNFVCTRSIMGKKLDSDSPRSAVIVMRKQ